MAVAPGPVRDEKFLASWRSRQRTARLSDEQRAAMAGLDPAWDEPKQTPWDVRFAEIQGIVASLGRLPKSTEKDPDNLSAYMWIQRQQKLPANHQRRAALDRALPGWDTTRQSLWDQKLALIVDYLAANGRFPPQHERTCGIWLSSQKRGVSPRRRAELDRRIPGWNRTYEDRWVEALDYVARYYSEKGRFPSVTSTDPEERFHGEWLSTQRKPGGSTPARTATLNMRIPGWQNGRDGSLWEARFKECLAFVAAEGRLPNQAAMATPSERVLANWIINQRRVSKDHERLTRLDTQLPGWRGRSKHR